MANTGTAQDASSDRSIREIYNSAIAQRSQLDYHDSRSAEFRKLLTSTINELTQCRQLISGLALFSPNEGLEDLSTQSLPYLTVDFLLAELLQRSYEGDRLAALTRVAELLDGFLLRLDQYSLLAESDRKLFERYQEEKTRFSILPKNPEDRRRLKIRRFQEEKELKRKLEVCANSFRCLLGSRSIRGILADSKPLQHLRTQSKSLNVDDEVERQLHLAEIAFFVHESFQALDSIAQEIAILGQIQQSVPTPMMDPRNDPCAPAREGGYSERLDGPNTMAGLGRKGGPLLDSKGKPMQPFTLLDKRSQLRDGVFKSGHNLPTMSIDEYLEEERRRGGIIEGGGNANEAQSELDEDNMDLVDAATMKARDWDEFVEANPKGAGNTLNRG
jgi:immunoglobulin-binding protein 1